MSSFPISLLCCEFQHYSGWVRLCLTFSLSVLIWMAFGMSLAVFSLVREVTSFSRIVIWIEREKDLLCVLLSVYTVRLCDTLILPRAWAYLYCSANKCTRMTCYLIESVTLTSFKRLLDCARVNVYTVGVPFTTYGRFPAEDVTVETEPVLWQIESALEQDVLLQSTGVVWIKKRENQVS